MTTKQVEALRTPEVQALLGRAAMYEMLSLAFAYPGSDWREDLTANLEDLRDHDLTLGLGLEREVWAVESALAEVDDAEVAADHTRLFAGEVPCSAHETEYALDPFVKGRQLADIAGFYRAFGLETGDAKGLPDFISTELEFMSFLVRKEAYAAVKGWSARAEICEKAERSFIESHLGRWLATFARQLATLDSPFYGAAAELASDFVAQDAVLMGANVAPIDAPRGRPEDAQAFTCGLETADEAEAREGLIEMLPVAEMKPAASETDGAEENGGPQ